MPIYLFSVLDSPKSVLKKICTIQCKFIWGGTDENKKWALVNWDTLCTPKDAGGLILQDLLNVNRVLVAKIW